MHKSKHLGSLNLEILFDPKGQDIGMISLNLMTRFVGE
jgi:hypothetical protein